MDRSLSATELVSGLARLEGWTLGDEGSELVIEKTYRFADFRAAMAFANAVAWMADEHGHHPELRVRNDRCIVRWRTHDAGGISRTDLDSAARVDALRRMTGT